MLGISVSVLWVGFFFVLLWGRQWVFLFGYVGGLCCFLVCGGGGLVCVGAWVCVFWGGWVLFGGVFFLGGCRVSLGLFGVVVSSLGVFGFFGFAGCAWLFCGGVLFGVVVLCWWVGFVVIWWRWVVGLFFWLVVFFFVVVVGVMCVFWFFCFFCGVSCVWCFAFVWFCLAGFLLIWVLVVGFGGLCCVFVCGVWL